MSKGCNRQGWKKARHSILAALLVVGIAACTDGGKDGGLVVSEARQLCHDTIKASALDAELVQIPPKDARETVRVFSFVWRMGDGLMMPGQNDTLVDTPVTCRVNKETREVVHLEIGGKTTIPG